MTELTVETLAKNFKKAVIIDLDKKSVWVVANKKVKVYPEKYYNELLNGLNLKDFETNGT